MAEAQFKLWLTVYKTVITAGAGILSILGHTAALKEGLYFVKNKEEPSEGSGAQTMTLEPKW